MLKKIVISKKAPKKREENRVVIQYRDKRYREGENGERILTEFTVEFKNMSMKEAKKGQAIRHKCPECKKTFTRKCNMRRHKERQHHHEKSGVINYKCPHCGEHVLSEQKLLQHAVIHTGQDYSSCKKCVEGFESTEAVMCHLSHHIIVPALVLGGHLL